MNHIQYQGPFLFLSNLSVSFDPAMEMFLLFVQSGSQMGAYAVEPSHVKRIMLALKKNLDIYEKSHGTIETELPEVGVKSPFAEPSANSNPPNPSSGDKPNPLNPKR